MTRRVSAEPAGSPGLRPYALFAGRGSAVLLALLFLISLLSAGIPAAQAAPRGDRTTWNVVLITLDATDAARIGTYGGSRAAMPFLDSLADKAVVFDAAYCTTGSTGPSHATILSGLLPLQHAVLYNGLGLSKSASWLPEILKKHGYATVGSAIVPYMGAQEGFTRGFDRYAYAKDEIRGHASNRAGYELHRESLGPGGWKDIKRPFFAWIHLKGGHAPLAPIDERYLRLFSTSLPPDRLPEHLKQGHFGEAGVPQSIPDWLAYYNASLREADDTVEQIYRDLSAEGLLDNTILLVTADHGESFDHGMHQEHWPSPWESTLRIPLIVHAPSRLRPARIRDRLVSTADITPTILDLLGLDDSDKRWTGGSVFRGFLRRSIVAASPYALVYERLLQDAQAGTNRKTSDELRSEIAPNKNRGLFYWAFIERSVRGGLFKLLYFEHGHFDNFQTGFQVYSLSNDPAESRDLILERAGRRQGRHMLARARQVDPLFAASPGLTTVKKRPGDLGGQPTFGLSPQTLKVLRSLGYIQ